LTKNLNITSDSLSVKKADDNNLIDKGTYFTKEKGNLLFRILSPENYDTSINYPLIIFLHGAGERGDDNERQLIHGAKLFEDRDNRKEFPAFVLFPQCPENSKWVDVDWTSESSVMNENPTRELELVILLIDKINKTYKIDTNRIYLMGISMGGFGVWDMICRYPDKFAAAVPICGGGDENQAFKIVNVPIRAFHGKQDKLVKVSRSRNMIDVIKKLGGNPKYTEYENVGHDAWNYAFSEPDLLKWLFSQKKSN
jgi:predicted peptidase